MATATPRIRRADGPALEAAIERTVTRVLIGVPPWAAASLREDVPAEDVIHALSEALEDEILAHPEVVDARAKLSACLDRVEASDPALAGELGDLVDLDHYCSIVRATLTAVLARDTARSAVES